MSKERAQKFNELLVKEVGKIIFEHLDASPGVLVTVTRVSTSANLFSSNVFVSVYPPSESEMTFRKLNRSIYQIQQILNKKLQIRPVPKIIFKLDKNPAEADAVERMIETIKNEKQQF